MNRCTIPGNVLMVPFTPSLRSPKEMKAGATGNFCPTLHREIIATVLETIGKP